VMSVMSGTSSSTGAHNFGGLVGYNTGSISNSFVSNGSVSGSGSGAYNFGGLVGQNDGTISNTYASGGTVSGDHDVGGLVGYNTGSIDKSYASNAVVSVGNAGGLVGNNAMTGSVSASFWNTTVAGAGVSYGIGFDYPGSGSNIGATGLDSAGMMTMSNFTNAGWDIADTNGAGTIWRIYDGVTMPLLSSFITETVQTSNVVDEIVEIVDQKPKKPDDVLAATTIGDGGNTSNLPVCN
jgi:hypothetical protein